MTRPRPGSSSFLAIATFLLLASSGLAAAAEAELPPFPYESESWPEARLLVWAHPGVDGIYHLPLNWLEAGEPATSPPDRETDVLLPESDRPYLVRPEIDGVGSEVSCRHITVERNAGFAAGYRDAHNITVYGNAWVKPGGRLNYVTIEGPKHTFIRYDGYDFTEGDFRCSRREVETWARNVLSWKFDVVKLSGGSVTFLGKIGIVDEFLVHSGKVVIGPDSEVRFGRTTTGAMEIFQGAVVELQSGAVLGPFASQMPREAQGNIRILRGGTLQGGSTVHPLQADAHVLVGFPGAAPPSKKVNTQDLLDPVGFARKLCAASDPFSRYLVELCPDLCDENMKRLIDRSGTPAISDDIAKNLCYGLERAISRGDFSDDALLVGIELSDETRRKLVADATGRDRMYANRAILDEVYPDQIARPRNSDGIYAAAGSRIEVHTSDPQRARLWVSSITSAEGQSGGITQPVSPSKSATDAEGIELNLAGEIDSNGLGFDYVRRGGIGLTDPASWRAWQGTSYGEHNAADAPASLFGPFRGPLDWAGWTTRNVAARGSVDQYLFRPEISPAGGAYLPGERVTVTISTRSNRVEIHYTTDGSRVTARSPVYRAPIVLTQSCTLHAAAFQGNRPAGASARDTLVEETFLFMSPRPATTGVELEPGLRYQMLSGGRPVPGRSGLASSLNWKDLGPLETDRDDLFLFTGFLEVPATGGYSFTTNHLGSALVLDGRVVLDTIDGSSKRGSICLSAGVHAMTVRVMPGRGGGRNPARFGDQELRLTVRGPGTVQQPIPEGWMQRAREQR